MESSCWDERFCGVLEGIVLWGVSMRALEGREGLFLERERKLEVVLEVGW